MFIHDRFPGDDDGTFIRDQSLKDCLTYSVMVSAQRIQKKNTHTSLMVGQCYVCLCKLCSCMLLGEESFHACTFELVVLHSV
jgi:hypothetical protein